MLSTKRTSQKKNKLEYQGREYIEMVAPKTVKGY